MKEFRQHQPTGDENNDVEIEHMYKFLYLVGNNEYYLRLGELENLGDTRRFRISDSKFIVNLED